MQFIKFVFVLSSTTLIGTLFCQSSNAFTVTQKVSLSDIGVWSTLPGGGESLTSLNVLDPDDPLNSTKSTRLVTAIERGGTKGLLNDLRLYTGLSRNPWTFKRGRDLQGRFNVKTHYACGIKTSCPEKKGGVGSVLRLKYIPEIRNIPGRIPDPNPTQNKNLHWIQRVITNYPNSELGAFGNRRSYIDNIIKDTGRNSENPYFGVTPAHHLLEPDGLFEDVPYRGGDLNRSFYWIGELYLAEANPSKPREVTIYNGVRWGWTHEYFRKPNPVRVPLPLPKPKPTPVPEEYCPPPGLLTKSGSTIVANSSSGGGGIGCVAVSPTPRPSPSPAPRPSPSPTPRPTQSPKPSPIVIVSVSPAPSPSPWTPSTFPTPTPWVTSPLGSTSSSVVVSTSTTTNTLPLPSPRKAPAPSPRKAPAPSSGPRPIRAVSISATSNRNAANLPSRELVKSSSKANTDYLSAISSDLLEDSELSSTDNSLNNANLASISSDLLENPELSSTESNENQVNLAGISSELLEDSELSSTSSHENQVNLADISSDLLEDPELSSTENDENNADIGGISADLLEDPELSSEDNNYNEVDLAGISADLLEDSELSYQDDTLTAEIPKVSSQNTDDDALSAEAVPEPTTALGTLFALAVLPVIKRLKNRKNKE